MELKPGVIDRPRHVLHELDGRVGWHVVFGLTHPLVPTDVLKPAGRVHRLRCARAPVAQRPRGERQLYLSPRRLHTTAKAILLSSRCPRLCAQRHLPGEFLALGLGHQRVGRLPPEMGALRRLLQSVAQPPLALPSVGSHCGFQ